MGQAAVYTVTYVMDDTSTRTTLVRGAPPFVAMASKAPKGARFCIRFFPSKKAFRVFNLRHLTQINIKGRLVPAAVHHAVELADYDAALMFARLRCD